jgi:fatty acid desaturase
MERTFNKAEDLADHIKEYVNARIDSIKLSVAEKVSAVLANILAGLVVAFVFLLFVILFSIGLALIIGEWIGHAWAGFLIVAGLYLFFGVIVWVARGKLIRLPIMNAIIQQLFRNDEDHQE